MRKILRILIVVFALPIADRLCAQVVFRVLPNSRATTPGNAALAVPFTWPYPVRFQQVYTASEFSLSSPPEGWITHIGFRGDSQGSGTLSNLQINLSTTPLGADALNSVFAENIGPDETIVFGPTRTGVFGGSGTFLDTRFALHTPFLYDPSRGNLLMDVRNYTGISYLGGHQAFDLDAENSPGDSVSCLYSTGVSNATGTSLTSGLVTQFTIAVPYLTVSLAGSDLFFRWRNNPEGLTLQQSPVIGSSAVWQLAGGMATTNGAYKEVTLPLNPSVRARFFRLILPPPGIAPSGAPDRQVQEKNLETESE